MRDKMSSLCFLHPVLHLAHHLDLFLEAFYLSFYLKDHIFIIVPGKINQLDLILEHLDHALFLLYLLLHEVDVCDAMLYIALMLCFPGVTSGSVSGLDSFVILRALSLQSLPVLCLTHFLTLTQLEPCLSSFLRTLSLGGAFLLNRHCS